ncbi:MAG: tRNA (adenosine(37)-N6)-threonylcarbamoyltransferase complex ATPase subunit type 1 TsaE [Neisseriaceae bacterium]
MLLADEVETRQLAQSFADVIGEPLLIFLKGDLGTGKTFWARSLIHSLGYSGSVKSPTYALLETYSTLKAVVNHFDLYRLADAREWYVLGFDEVVSSKAINLVEWPERIAPLNLCPDVLCTLSYETRGRRIEIIGQTDVGKELVRRWRKN